MSRGKRAALVSLLLATALSGMTLYVCRERILEEYLLWKLGSATVGERRGAAERLGRMKSLRAVPRLKEVFVREIALLRDQRDPSESGLHYSGSALVEIGRPALPALVELSQAEPPRVRQEALAALAAMGKQAEEVFPHIARRVADDDREVRVSAMHAVREIKPEDVSPAIPPLVENLKSTDDRLQWISSVVLADLGSAAEPAIPDLIEALLYTRGNTLYRVEKCLRNLGEPAAAALVDTLRESERGELRATAAQMLGFLVVGSRGIFVLTIPPEDEQRYLHVVRSLTESLRDPSGKVRSSAIGALGKYGAAAKSAAPALAELITDEACGRGAVRALESIGVSSEHLGGILREKLDGSSEDTRKNAARALADLEPVEEETVASLVEAAGSESAVVREAAVRALGKAGKGNESAGSCLLGKLDDDNPRVRAAAVSALVSVVADPEVLLPRFIHTLEDDESHLVRSRAAYYISELGALAGSAVPHLVEALDDENRNVRNLAAAALGNIGPPAAEKAVPALARALDDEWDSVRAHAVIALEKLGAAARPALPALKRVSLSDRHQRLRVFARDAIARIEKAASSP